MEKNLKVKTVDGKIIDGILRGDVSKPLIVLVHGLCGNMNEAMHYNAARYFERHGFSSFRFNLYSWGKNNRKLHECTLKTHGQDIDRVLAYLKLKGAKQIFMVGHSYGLPSILHTKDRSFKAVISWDGSYLPRNWFAKLERVGKLTKGRIIDEGYLTIMGEEMALEARKVNSLKLIKNLNKPIKFITIPGKSGNLSGSKKMYAAISGPKEITIIIGASHNFTEDGKQEELYMETVKWFKNYLIS